MKITEIISESEDSIKTYWALQSIDIERYYRIYQKLNEVFPTNEEQKMILKSDYMHLYSLIDDLLKNEKWEYLESDLDYEKVYSGLLDMYKDLKHRLTTKY